MSSEEISASAEDMAQISQRSSDRTDRVKESIQQQEKSVQEISISIEHMHNAKRKTKTNSCPIYSSKVVAYLSVNKDKNHPLLRKRMIFYLVICWAVRPPPQNSAKNATPEI